MISERNSERTPAGSARTADESRPSTRRTGTIVAFALAAGGLLQACGGGGGSEASTAPSPPPVVPASTLAGTVAVGAALTDGKLRIIDANGAVVAQDIPIDADGNYSGVTLTGPGPYRLEACGYSGAEYQCIYSVAEAAGRANVTTLTTAVVLLATGDAPDTLMSGTAEALTANNIDMAQAQLRTGLSAVLEDADVAADVDFMTAPLDAGSRTGYDRVLDAVGVTTGEDANAFVQITPRLGSGNLYLEQGSSSGTLTVDAGAATLDLAGIDALFENLTRAVADAASCSAAGGLRASLAANPRLSFGRDVLAGADQVASGLCAVFAGELDDSGDVLFGAQFQNPVLGRCDLDGSAPICRVSFALRRPDGEVQEISDDLGIAYEGGAWKLLGSVSTVTVQASARAQRDERIDGETRSISYSRALSFEVPAIEGVACADVQQRSAEGEWVRVALYKPHPGEANLQSLSVWRSGNDGSARSLDPATGVTRGSDDTQLMLPDGADGDAVVRNFYRGGRMVRVSLHADDACTVAATIDGRDDASVVEVEIDGVPPVAAALAGLAWPEIDDATRARLRTFEQAANSDGTFASGWTFQRGPIAMGDTLFCAAAEQGDCGRGGTGRLGDHNLRQNAMAYTLAVRTRDAAVTAGDTKLFSLTGRLRDGLGLQANYVSCTNLPAGDRCAPTPPPNPQ